MEQGQIFMTRHEKLLKKLDSLPINYRIFADDTLELAYKVKKEHHTMFGVYKKLVANWRNMVESDFREIGCDGDFKEFRHEIKRNYNLYLQAPEKYDWFMVENTIWMEELFLMGFPNGPEEAVSARMGATAAEVGALYKKSLPELDKLAKAARKLSETEIIPNDPKAMTLEDKIRALQEAVAS